jgi:hypothetical protein
MRTRLLHSTCYGTVERVPNMAALVNRLTPSAIGMFPFHPGVPHCRSIRSDRTPAQDDRCRFHPLHALTSSCFVWPSSSCRFASPFSCSSRIRIRTIHSSVSHFTLSVSALTTWRACAHHHLSPVVVACRTRRSRSNGVRTTARRIASLATGRESSHTNRPRRHTRGVARTLRRISSPLLTSSSIASCSPVSILPSTRSHLSSSFLHLPASSFASAPLRPVRLPSASSELTIVFLH